jgi:hypothetical protein
MTDQVSITWTDATGTYTSAFLIENPTLAEVKAALSSPMMPVVVAPKAETPEEFYARVLRI